MMATTENAERNWVVGVNREGFDISSTKSFANLFVHEYGHVLVYDYKDFVNNFKDSFWTAEDIRHQERVVKTSGDKRFSLTKDYYEDNKQRFVSDYATNSFDEDLAETFVYFIREDKPIGNTIRDQKIRTFYQESDLVEKRTQIRANLRGLGVL